MIIEDVNLLLACVASRFELERRPMAPQSRTFLVVVAGLFAGWKEKKNKLGILQLHQCESAAVQQDSTTKPQLIFFFLSIIAVIIITLVYSVIAQHFFPPQLPADKQPKILYALLLLQSAVSSRWRR